MDFPPWRTCRSDTGRSSSSRTCRAPREFTWTRRASLLPSSHETLEMLGDPFGNRMIAGPSPRSDQGRVEFFVEVCDPSEDADCAYTVNDVLVSDFYTPHYFDPVKQDQVRYSYTGAITEPRQVLPGGYLSWHNPTDDHWYQLTYFGQEPQFRDLGVLARHGQSLRAVIDSLTPQTKRLSHLPRQTAMLTGAVDAASSAERATSARAESLRQQIAELPRGGS